MIDQRVALMTFALVFAFASAPRAGAQSCQSNQDGTSNIVISESNPEEALNSNFCDGDPGLDFCATTQGILLSLQLSGVANVDITCELTLPSENNKGRICIATDGCEESEFVPAREDDQRIRLVGGLLPSTDYKIAVFDIGSDANFCEGTPDLKVKCTGDFGSEPDECFTLSTEHTPDEGGADPTAEPTQSGSCSSTGEYQAGEQIEVTAAPAEGWEMANWEGTNDNASTSTTNTVTMPAAQHEVVAVYTRPISAFDSPFEKDGFCDWSSRHCDSCDVFSCHLSAGENSVPLNSYRTPRTGEHRGMLIGPEDTDFDLVLQWWNGSDWLPVASRLSPSSSEEVVYEGDPGLYRWEITSASGSGRYDLAIAYPGLVRAESNHLDQVKRPRKEGKHSLRATFDKKSKSRDYLMDSSPGIGSGETSYEASFWIRPDTDLFVKGKKHQIFQLLQKTEGVAKPKPIVEAFLRLVKGGQNRYGLSVRVQTDGAGRPRSPFVPFIGGVWTPIKIVWRAASDASLADGLIELYLDGELEWSMDLPNFPHRVDRAHLGQVSKGSKKTEGILYLDDFRSSWED